MRIASSVALVADPTDQSDSGYRVGLGLDLVLVPSGCLWHITLLRM